MWLLVCRYTLCSNGVQDSDAGETGVDCGGDGCAACGVTFSSADIASSGDASCAPPSFTATFATDTITNVTAADFHLNTGGITDYSTTLTQRAAPNADEWVLDVAVASGFMDATMSVWMPAGSGDITPPHGAGVNNGFSIAYSPPAPTLSSEVGATGSSTANTSFNVTATFDSAVSMAASDFVVTVDSDIGVATSAVSQAGGTEWVLTVTLSAPWHNTAVTVDVPEGVTDSTCLNAAASNGGFVINFAANPCHADPCGLAFGNYADACDVVDATAGTYTCTCKSGRFGTNCRNICPDGYELSDSDDAFQCLSVVGPTNYNDATAACAVYGPMAGVHSAAQNAAARAYADANGGDGLLVWLGADDLVEEGTWVWQDGTPYPGPYTNWVGINPDDANGVQDCLAMRTDGQWDDRKCSVNYFAVCSFDSPLCSNGLLDADTGETGVDCGGHCGACTGVTVTYLSDLGANGAVVSDTYELTFTAVFSTAVSGVTEADFGLTVSSSVDVGTTTLVAVGGEPAEQWVLMAALNGTTFGPATVQVAAMAVSQGAITPAVTTGNTAFSLLFDPPKPVYSSALGATGATFSGDTFTITATFDGAVSGVTAAHFGVSATGGLAFDTAVSPSSGAAQVWVYTGTITSGRVASTITATAFAGGVATGLSPATEAGDGDFTLVYQPPVPTYTSSVGVSGSTTQASSFDITATFSSAVRGVTNATFGLSFTGATVYTATATSGNGMPNSDVWVLTVTMVSAREAGTFTAAAMAEASTGVAPANAAGATAFTVVYDPPLFTGFSSSTAATGTTVTAGPLLFTATFSSAVSGVSVQDFRMNPSTVNVDATIASDSGAASDTTWVLTVTPVSALAAGTVTVLPVVEASNFVSPANGVADGANTAYTLTFDPPVATYSSSLGASGDTTNDEVLTVTATFSSPVSGVVAADFGFDANGLDVSTPSITPVGGAPATEWTFSTTIQSGFATTTVTWGAMTEATGAVSPANGAMTGDDFSLTFAAAVPTLSSSLGASGSRTGETSITFTATFTSAVTEPTFNLNTGTLGVSTAVASDSGSSTDTIWVATVTLNSNLVQTAIVCSLEEGAADPYSLAATNNGYTLVYMADPCDDDPCDITSGRALSCATDSQADGTFTCTCATGWFGGTCADLCPDGYKQLDQLSPPRCARVTDSAVAWSDAATACGSDDFMSVHSDAANAAAVGLCVSQVASDSGCWLGGTDAAVEGTWVWQDGTPFDYEAALLDVPVTDASDCLGVYTDGWAHL